MLTIGRVAGVEEAILRVERVADCLLAALVGVEECFATDDRVGYKRSRWPI